MVAGKGAYLMSASLLKSSIGPALKTLEGILVGPNFIAAVNAAAGPVGWAVAAAAIIVAVVFILTRDGSEDYT